MATLFALLNGPEDLGRGPIFWSGAAIVIALFLAVPLYLSDFAAYNVSYYLLNIPMALGLCLLWGYCGVLSFGQVAYFGIAGYAYGVIAGNFVGHSWGPMLGSLGGLVAAAIVAAVFGYFVFFARVQMWILPILTLVLTLLLETFLGQTAGYQWRIGVVQLGGYNGMTGIPAFQIGDFVFSGYSFFYLALGLALVCYLACRMLVNSRHGKVMLAIREDAAAHRDARLRHPHAAMARVRAGRASRRPLGAPLCAVGQLYNAVPGRPALRGAAGHLGCGGRT